MLIIPQHFAPTVSKYVAPRYETPLLKIRHLETSEDVIHDRTMSTMSGWEFKVKPGEVRVDRPQQFTKIVVMTTEKGNCAHVFNELSLSDS